MGSDRFQVSAKEDAARFQCFDGADANQVDRLVRSFALVGSALGLKCPRNIR